MKTLFIKRIDEYINHGEYFVLGPSIIYCPKCKAEGYNDMLLAFDMFNSSDSNAGTVLMRSKDGGSTWHDQCILERPYVYDFDGSRVKSGYGSLYADEKTGVILYLANDTYWEGNNIKSIWKKRTLYYRLSYDNGYTWTDKRYIVQQKADQFGAAYDKMHFIKDVTFGINMAALVSPRVIRGDDNSLLVGVQTQITDELGQLFNPTGMGFMKCGALKAFWSRDILDYVWDLGEYVQVSSGLSTRGLCEPAFENLGNGKILMVMRGSNAGKSEEIEGVKFFSVSLDNGLSWSEAKPLKYDDGTVMYSSSCIPKLIKHSSGRLYYIGVINKENPNGNLPRYPLCIAEIDKEKLCIKKSTVTVIDTKRDFQYGIDTKNVVDFSNHGVYEDAKTGEIIVLSPFRKNLEKYACSLNKYIIT